jgi:hypothetical protein
VERCDKNATAEAAARTDLSESQAMGAVKLLLDEKLQAVWSAATKTQQQKQRRGPTCSSRKLWEL